MAFHRLPLSMQKAQEPASEEGPGDEGPQAGGEHEDSPFHQRGPHQRDSHSGPERYGESVKPPYMHTHVLWYYIMEWKHLVAI